MQLTTISLLLTIFAVAGHSLAAETAVKPAARAADSAEAKKDSADNKKSQKPAKKTTETPKTPPTLTEITMDQLEGLLKDPAVIVVNALESGDMIKGSIRISANADDKLIADTLKDKSAQIVAYCGGGGCPAGSTLAYRLVELGYTNVKHYGGGLKEWKANDKPLKEDAK